MRCPAARFQIRTFDPTLAEEAHPQAFRRRLFSLRSVPEVILADEEKAQAFPRRVLLQQRAHVHQMCESSRQHPSMVSRETRRIPVEEMVEAPLFTAVALA